MSESNDEFSDEAEAVIQAFERSWNPEIDIHDYVPPADASDPLLKELLCIDLERRVRSGVPVVVDEYLTRFPRLTQSVLTQLRSQRHQLIGSKTTVLGEDDGSLQPEVFEQSLAKFGHFQSLQRIGQGGMGIVYKAIDARLNREVALKLFHSRTRRSYLVEGEAAARLRHPNIVRLLETSEINGIPYLAMEYVSGVSLSDLSSAGTVTSAQAVSYLRRIAAAVHYAHKNGVLHRDLTPNNVLIDQQDEPQVIDFGIAKITDSIEQHTLTGAMMGTRGFMSPEQLRDSKNVDSRSDVYSLGALLAFTLTGRPVLTQNATIDRDLRIICETCTAEKPEHRYQSAELLSEDLQRYASDEPLLARAPSPWERGSRWYRKNRLIANLFSAIALLLLTVGALLFALYRSSAKDLQESQSALQESKQFRNESEKALALLQRYLGVQRCSNGKRVQGLHLLAQSYVGLPDKTKSLDLLSGWGTGLDPLVHDSQPTAVEVSPDGQRLAVGLLDGDVWIWDLSTPKHTRLSTLGEDKLPDAVQSIQFSEKRHWLLCGWLTGEKRKVAIWQFDNTRSRFKRWKKELTDQHEVAAISPDETTIVFGEGAALKFVDVSSPEAAESWAVDLNKHADVRSGEVLNIVGKIQFTRGPNTRQVSIPINRRAGTKDKEKRPDRRLVCVFDFKEEEFVVRLGDATFDAKRPGMDGGIVAYEHSPDGESIYASDLNGFISVWTLDGRMKTAPTRHLARAMHLDSSSNVLLTGSNDHSVKFWDISGDTPKELIADERLDFNEAIARVGFSIRPSQRQEAFFSATDQTGQIRFGAIDLRHDDQTSNQRVRITKITAAQAHVRGAQWFSESSNGSRIAYTGAGNTVWYSAEKDQVVRTEASQVHDICEQDGRIWAISGNYQKIKSGEERPILSNEDGGKWQLPKTVIGEQKVTKLVNETIVSPENGTSRILVTDIRQAIEAGTAKEEEGWLGDSETRCFTAPDVLGTGRASFVTTKATPSAENGIEEDVNSIDVFASYARGGWLFNTQDPTRSFVVGEGTKITAAAFGPNQTLLTATMKSGQAGFTLWSYKTDLQPIGVSQLMPFPSAVLALSSDGKLAASSTRRAGEVHLIELVDDGEEFTFKNGHTLSGASSVLDLKFARNNRFLLGTSQQYTTHLWNVTTGRPVCSPWLHDRRVAHSIHPDSHDSNVFWIGTGVPGENGAAGAVTRWVLPTEFSNDASFVKNWGEAKTGHSWSRDSGEPEPLKYDEWRRSVEAARAIQDF